MNSLRSFCVLQRLHVQYPALRPPVAHALQIKSAASPRSSHVAASKSRLPFIFLHSAQRLRSQSLQTPSLFAHWSSMKELLGLPWALAPATLPGIQQNSKKSEAHQFYHGFDARKMFCEAGVVFAPTVFEVCFCFIEVLIFCPSSENIFQNVRVV